MHVVRRDSVSGNLELKIGGGPFEPCSEEQVRSLLPIQAYSQKQLSDVSVRLEELTRFITTPIRTQLATIDQHIAAQQAIVREKYSARERRRSLEAATAQKEVSRNSLEQQAAEIRKRLTGLSEEDKTLIDAAPSYQEAARVVSSWTTGLTGVRDVVKQVHQRIETTKRTAEKVPNGPEADILAGIRADYLATVDRALSALADAEGVAEAALKGRAVPGSAWDAWQKKEAEFQRRYKQAAERSTTHAQRLRDLAALEKQLGEVRGEIDRLHGDIAGLSEADAACDAARGEINRLRSERAELLSRMCETLSKQSGELIKARIDRSVDVTRFVETLKDGLKGSGLRAPKIDALSQALADTQDRDRAHADLLAELEQLAIHHDTAAGESDLPRTPFLLRAGFSAADVQRVAKALTQSEWLRLSLVPLEDHPVFEYRSKESEYIPFSNASAGQQATALLSTLLNSDGPPLIIDQPEEDLDNNVIGDIVEMIWVAKHKRQLLFASHNANLVVNGDADLVACCTYRSAGDQSGGKIAHEGAIDVPAVKAAITEVMEGGEAAFVLRRQKYGF